MAEKNQQSSASANIGYPRMDEESATLQSGNHELKRQKRIKCFAYIGIFIVFQIILIFVSNLTVMKLKTPKVRLGAINIQSLNAVPATPSFDTTFTTQIRVKNTNWGPYKFYESIATFRYQGVAVGQVIIPKSKAAMRSTKKVEVTVSLNSKGLPSSNLGSDLSGGILTLSSQAMLNGYVERIFVLKNTKLADMDCTIAFDLSSKTVQSLQCK